MATRLGTVSIILNSMGQLRRLDWISLDQASELFDPSISERGPVGSWLSTLFRYFEHGEPLKDILLSDIDVQEWTEFQKKVYQATIQIPHGETRNYLWVAKKCGLRGGAQAVGQALKRNPLPVFVPCHRVTPQNTLGGFMGKSDPSDPELALKKKLLNLESEYRNPIFSFLN